MGGYCDLEMTDFWYLYLGVCGGSEGIDFLPFLFFGGYGGHEKAEFGLFLLWTGTDTDNNCMMLSMVRTP